MGGDYKKFQATLKSGNVSDSTLMDSHVRIHWSAINALNPACDVQAHILKVYTMSTATTLGLSDDIIDTCDLIARFEELEDQLVDGTPECTEALAEYKVLQSILEDMRDYGGDEKWRGDWYPSTLIRESHFEEYMNQMVYDCYEMPKDLPSFMTIVLDYVALQQDYTAVEIDGATYFYR